MEKEYTISIQFEPENKSWVTNKVKELLDVSISDESMFAFEKDRMDIFGLTHKEERILFSELEESDKVKNIQSQEMMSEGGVTPEKARKILHDGEIRGKKLTEPQRKFFGARASGYPEKHGKGGEMTDERIGEILNQYIITALWSETDPDNDDEPLDSNYSRHDIDSETIERMERDVRRFVEENYDLLAESGLDDEQIGHDLWLTRNHHGAGFWDRDIPKNIGKTLTESAHEMKEAHLEIGDDGKIHQLGGKEFKGGGEAKEEKENFMDYYAKHGAVMTSGSYFNDDTVMGRGGKVYPQKRVSMTKRGRGIDKKVKAMKAGWRKSKKTGNFYFERRSNRSDSKPHKKI